MQAKTPKEIVFVQKSSNAYRIDQTINVLASSSAPIKTLQVPKKDQHVVQKIIDSKNLNGHIKVELIQ